MANIKGWLRNAGWALAGGFVAWTANSFLQLYPDDAKARIAATWAWASSEKRDMSSLAIGVVVGFAVSAFIWRRLGKAAARKRIEREFIDEPKRRLAIATRDGAVSLRWGSNPLKSGAKCVFEVQVINNAPFPVSVRVESVVFAARSGAFNLPKNVEPYFTADIEPGAREVFCCVRDLTRDDINNLGAPLTNVVHRADVEGSIYAGQVYGFRGELRANVASWKTGTTMATARTVSCDTTMLVEVVDIP